MSHLTLNILLQVATLTAAGRDYATAYHETAETGRPLVVLIGADWCPGCQQMKYSAIPELEKKGGLNKVSFAIVNTDQQSELAGKLMRGGSIPQLVMYHKTQTGWARQQLTGAHSATEIQSFLAQAAEAADASQLSSMK
jgi:thioredoxin-like negative regulator of GroEL